LTDRPEPPEKPDSPAPAQYPTAKSRLRRAWPTIRIAVALAAIGLAAYVVSGKTEELTGVTGYLDHLRWWWLIVAVAAELLSYGALSSLQRRLLRAGKVRVPAGTMFGITVASGAIQYSFPGGGVIFLAYLYRQFRRWGADDLLAVWVVAAFNIVIFIALGLLSATGLALAFGAGSTNDLVLVILSTVAASAILTVVVVERRRLVPHITRAVGLSQRLFRWPHHQTPAPQLVESWTAELGAVSPSRAVWARAFVMGVSNWLADLSCLVLSFFAVGVGVPWRGLLLAYAAGQLATTLPITPGGLGAAEGALTIGLVDFGGGTDATVAAVLLYRLVSFWMILPIGWGAWSALAVQARRAKRAGSEPLSALESRV
jgi:putative heme transporter